MVDLGNTIYFLFPILLLLSIEILFLFRFDYLQPSFIFTSTMCVSALLACLKVKEWELFVGPDTTLIVIFGILAFLLGSILGNSATNFKDDSSPKSYFVLDKRFTFKVIILSLGMLVLAYFSYREIYTLSLQVGNTNGISGMIKAIRYPLERGEVHFSRWNRYRKIIADILFLISSYLFIYQRLVRKVELKKLLVLLLPIFLYLPFSVFTTGRRDLVHCLISVCVMWGIVYQYIHNQTVKSRLHLVSYFCGMLFVAVCCYFLLGHLTGKVITNTRGPFTIIAHYGGLSIPALEHYLSAPLLENGYYGQNTLMPFYGNLNNLGFHLEKGRDFLLFTRFKGIDTNVYSVLYRQITDYGLTGCGLLLFSFGAIFTYAYGYLKAKVSSLGVMLYGMFGYVPFFLFIDDQFMTMFATDRVYKISLLWLIFRWLTIKKVDSDASGSLSLK